MDTYLQKLLYEGNIDACLVGTNTYDVPIVSEDFETPPTYTTKKVLVLSSENDVHYTITEEQLEMEKDLMFERFPDKTKEIMKNYKTLKMELEK